MEEKKVKKENKSKVKNNKARMNIFYIVVALIVIAIIALIVLGITNLINKDENPGNNTEVVDGESVNPDAKPEDMPSIAGNSNVDEVNGVRVNNSVALKSDKKFEQYVISNISLEAASGGTVLTAKITAPTATEKLTGRDVVINFYNREGKLISIMNAYIGQIKPGETLEFRAESTSDLANAYDIEIVAK